MKDTGRGYRIASRIIGYGGILACIAAAVAWYIVKVRIGKDTTGCIVLFGIPTLPLKLAVMLAGLAAAFVVLAVILRIYARRSRTEEEYESYGANRILGKLVGGGAESLKQATSVAAIVIGCAATALAIKRILSRSFGREEGVNIRITPRW